MKLLGLFVTNKIQCFKINYQIQNISFFLFWFLLLWTGINEKSEREFRETGFHTKKNCNNERRNKMIFYISTSSNDLNTNTPNLKFCQLRKRKYKFLEKNIVNERKKSAKEEKK